MANLFDISTKYVQLVQELEDVMATIEPDEDLEVVAEETLKKLQINEEEVKDKIEAYYYFIKQQEGEINLLKDEQARLGDKVKSKENLIKRLKKSVDDALRLFGQQTDKGNYKLKTDKLSVWNVFHKPVNLSENFYHHNYMNFKIKRSFNHDEVTALQEYLQTKGIIVDLDSTPDVKLIKEDLKTGKDIPGAEIDTNASYVRFK